MMNKVDDENLPPGFRFHPMDEELITYYLTQKVLDSTFSCRAIAEVDLNKCEPWDLPARAKMGEKEWYFFSLRDRKYPTGLRTNRATQAGYWKATGKDREIFKGRTSSLVGMKKTLVFYKGRAPKGEKSNWVMHEYRLEGRFSYSNLPKTAKDEWVVTRIFQKSSGAKKGPLGPSRSSNYLNDMDSPALPPLLESPYVAMNNEGASSESAGSAMDQQHVTCFSTPMDSHSHPKHPYFTAYNKNLRPQPNSSSLPSDSVDLSFLHNIMLSDPSYINTGNSGLRQMNQDSQLNAPQMSQQLPSFSGPPINNFPHVFSQGGFPSSSILRALVDQYSGVDMIGSLKQCKMEPPSSSFAGNNKAMKMQPQWENLHAKYQPMVSMSQETGLTTEVNNTEISSVVSSQLNNNSNHQPYTEEGNPSAELDCFWSY